MRGLEPKAASGRGTPEPTEVPRALRALAATAAAAPAPVAGDVDDASSPVLPALALVAAPRRCAGAGARHDVTAAGAGVPRSGDHRRAGGEGGAGQALRAGRRRTLGHH